MKALFPRVLEQLQEATSGLSDAQLLARFLSARDEVSFAALVRRHGPMVLAVCRRVLHDFHHAEDAFQATFLVLATKASSVLKRESLGSWLHSVAYHTALAAARADARRQARERRAENMDNLPSPEREGPSSLDWRPHLDRELNRLSERYRKVVILCDLEGASQKEAARTLGVPPGTVSSRLTRARALLARRLSARGITLSSAALAGLIAADATSAQVPVALASSLARVAALVVAGQLTAASGPAVVLMKGVMKAMLVKKLKLVIGSLLVVAALGTVPLAWRSGDTAWAQEAAQRSSNVNPPTSGLPGKPLSELEALRRENEDLRATVRVLLKEIQSMERDLEASRTRTDPEANVWPNRFPKAGEPAAGPSRSRRSADVPATQPDKAARPKNPYLNNIEPQERPKDVAPDRQDMPARPKESNLDQKEPRDGLNYRGTPSVFRGQLVPDRSPTTAAELEVEAALKELREARDAQGRQRAAAALERGVKRLREELNLSIDRPPQK
jgi:RNA polymerase sigma factor (sigma-70 family)